MSEPTDGAGWTTPDRAVDPGRFVDVRARWEGLAAAHPGLVRVLEPGADVVEGEVSLGVAPALVEVVGALPGVEVGPIRVDWASSASQRWPSLGDRSAYQPLWALGREALVVVVDPVSGEAGAVLRVADDDSVSRAAADVVAWWEAFTAWAEEHVPPVAAVAAEESADDEEQAEVFGEVLEQVFFEWIARPW